MFRKKVGLCWKGESNMSKIIQLIRFGCPYNNPNAYCDASDNKIGFFIKVKDISKKTIISCIDCGFKLIKKNPKIIKYQIVVRKKPTTIFIELLCANCNKSFYLKLKDYVLYHKLDYNEKTIACPLCSEDNKIVFKGKLKCVK